MLFRLSPRVRLLLALVGCFFAAFVAMRLGFYLYFLAGDIDESATVFWKAVFIGVRFDLRVALLIALPVILISVLPGRLSLRRSVFMRWLCVAWLVVTAVGSLLFYIFDFGHYSYLGERINASVLRFLEDGSDSVQMIWESYPVVTLMLLVIAVAFGAGVLFFRLLSRYADRVLVRRGWFKGTLVSVVCVVVYAHGIMGKVGTTVPLRWSDAYFANNEKVAALALNPYVYFISSITYETRRWDPEVVRQEYGSIARWLGVDSPDRDELTFMRRRAGDRDPGKPLPNVVFIHLESLGANRMGLYGNPLDATPNLDRMGRNGLFFPNFMVPSSGTARTVFGLVTSIPDFTWGGRTATRDPKLVNQYTLVNEFDGYERLYFIGGSAGWANVRGILTNNIEDLELWEEGAYDAPKVDVWGISDRSLFQAAHGRLKQLKGDGPFVAFIQTAGNHRPFTIPDDDSDFRVRELPDEKVQKHSFLGTDQYNGARLLDYNIDYYINDLVEGSWYEGNTIYVMYGDHNDRSESSNHMGYSEALGLEKFHVPLIIYAPGIIDRPRVIEKPTSLVDIMPTTLGLTGLPYENRTLGRDMLEWDKKSYATTFGGNRTQNPRLGLLGDEYLLKMLHDGEKVRLYPLKNPSLDNEVSKQRPELARERAEFLEGLYQTARYMMYNNPKGAQ